MKLIACDLCLAVIPLGYRMRSCLCENIKGKYLKDGRKVEIYVKDMGTSRILGLQNSVRFGFEKQGEAWVIDFDDWTVKKLVLIDQKITIKVTGFNEKSNEYILLACDLCRTVIPLDFERTKSCRCGNIDGKYINDYEFKVCVSKDIEKCRTLGLANSVRFGRQKRAIVRVIDFNDKVISLFKQWFKH